MTSVAAPAGLHGRRSPGSRCKELLLGPPLATSRLARERLRKVVALAVFSSDAISSTAYGTEQIMLVLVAAGAVATGLAFPIALGIGALLTILILSYRQTITAYPSAGGAYIVSRDNFGPRWAVVAGSALLIDYVLTVAVSVTSGVAALTTALPALQRVVLPLSLAAIVLIMWANLRGVRESGRIFAVPTDLFVGSCAVMLLVGLGRLATGHLDPVPAGGTAPLPPATASLGVLLVLHAFAAGCTALTGVEAISNGVPAFRPPEARNARRTLVAMGMILGSLFIGVSFLAVRMGVRPYESGNPTLIGQLARWVLGGSTTGLAFFLFQAATLAILVLAANTSFADFPRLMSFAAADRFLPRWFTKRGQRLVYSNGVLALSAAAALVTLAFRADYNRMLPLYAIGVFTSFTFSQAGMTRRHLRLREPGWRYGIAVNGVGAVVTFLVLLDIIATKFAAGAWIVLLILPLLVLLLDRTNRAYAREREELEVEAPELLAPPKPRHEVLVLVDELDRAVLHALQYAGQLNPLSITALHVAADPDTARRLARLWARLPGAVPLEVVHCPNRDLVDCAVDAVDERARPDTEVTVLLPRHGDRGRFRRLLHDQTGRDLFAALNRLAGVNVAIVHLPAAAARHPATSASARTMVP
ncbi:MAG TPA: APC family permease [Actinomycetes bacterium]|nr:APC family permease [Actinomycetes bacterium]